VERAKGCAVLQLCRGNSTATAASLPRTAASIPRSDAAVAVISPGPTLRDWEPEQAVNSHKVHFETGDGVPWLTTAIP
jgi:predicted nucleic acid-binding Zn ribbon protein